MVICWPHPYIAGMEHFDFRAPADVFVGTGRKTGRCPMVYRRFENGAEAIRHVIEAVEPASLPGAVVETDEARLDAAEIRAIYQSADFPLERRSNRNRLSDRCR